MKITQLFLSSLILFFVATLQPNEAQAFLGGVTKGALGPLSKKGMVLAEDEIIKLARMIRGPGDVTKVKKIIGEMKLSSEAIEDTYVRIAIQRGNLRREEAETMFKNLRGVDGFSSTMSKILGVGSGMNRGHLNELRIASAAADRGFKVEGIGIKYSDGIKKSPTDLDILISKNGKKFPIEAKDYDDINLTSLSNTMRPDMDSLVAYRRMASSPNAVHPVFTVTHQPSDPSVLKLMQREASKRGIELVYGSPDEQLIQLEQLLKIVN